MTGLFQIISGFKVTLCLLCGQWPLGDKSGNRDTSGEAMAIVLGLRMGTGEGEKGRVKGQR